MSGGPDHENGQAAEELAPSGRLMPVAEATSSIDNDANPGGLVAVLWCPRDGVVARSLLTPGGQTAEDHSAGRDHAALAEQRVTAGLPTPWVALYDGDDGQLVYLSRCDYVQPTLGAWAK